LARGAFAETDAFRRTGKSRLLEPKTRSDVDFRQVGKRRKTRQQTGIWRLGVGCAFGLAGAHLFLGEITKAQTASEEGEEKDLKKKLHRTRGTSAAALSEGGREVSTGTGGHLE